MASGATWILTAQRPLLIRLQKKEEENKNRVRVVKSGDVKKNMSLKMILNNAAVFKNRKKINKILFHGEE